MRVKLIRQMAIHPKRVKEGFPPFYEAGKVIDHPESFRLVQQGVAVPADKECEIKCALILPRMDELVLAGDMRERAIDIEDQDAFKRGLMVGYKPDGAEGDTWIPGPNWTPDCEHEYYSDDEDDDDE